MKQEIKEEIKINTIKPLGNDFYLDTNEMHKIVYYAGKKENFVKSLLCTRIYDVVRNEHLYFIDQITKTEDNNYIIGNNKELVKELIVPKDISIKDLHYIVGYNCNVFDKIDLSNTKFSTLPRINNSDIKEIILPETLEYLGSYNFQYCDSLESIKIPKNVKKISDGCFQYCSSLKEIDLGNVEIIGNYVFDGCTSLTHIEFPNTLESIGISAFEECGLTSIEIPDTVKRIKSNAFAACHSLEYIMLPSKENTKYGNYILAFVSDLTIIYNGTLLDFLSFMRSINKTWKLICLNDNPDDMPANVMKVNKIDKDNINVLLQLMESGLIGNK